MTDTSLNERTEPFRHPESIGGGRVAIVTLTLPNGERIEGRAVFFTNSHWSRESAMRAAREQVAMRWPK